jgi:hypothetical protein
MTSARPLASAIARLLAEETFHDVVFVVRDERIGAVRALVAARSDHWERAFYGPCRESTESEVVVGETDPQTFRHLLHFVHTDQLPAVFDLPTDAADKAKHESPYDQFFALWELAERYNMPDLKALLCDRLQDHLHITQPVRLLELVADREAEMPEELYEQLHGSFESALRRNVGPQNLLETFDKVLPLSPAVQQQARMKWAVEEARAACVRWIRDNGGKLMIKLIRGEKQQHQQQKQRWLKASAALVEAVLSCQIMNVSELDVFEALVAWWQHDPNGRTEQAREMVPRVLRLPLLTFAGLADVVEPRGLLSMEQLKDAYKCLARHSCIDFGLSLNAGTDTTREVHCGGYEWSFRLRVDKDRLRIVPTRSMLTTSKRTVTASVFIGRESLCQDIKLTTTTGQSFDVSSFMGSTTNVTILFHYP